MICEGVRECPTHKALCIKIFSLLPNSWFIKIFLNLKVHLHAPVCKQTGLRIMAKVGTEDFASWTGKVH